METMKSSSMMQQPDTIVGPTCIIMYKNEQITEEKDEETGEVMVTYTYDFYRFTHSEYDNLKANGTLPAGATWDDILRSIERSGMYDWADTMIAKANDYIACGTEEQASAWETYRNELRTWKMAVRNTQTKKGYPKKVTYPGRPTTPE